MASRLDCLLDMLAHQLSEQLGPDLTYEERKWAISKALHQAVLLSRDEGHHPEHCTACDRYHLPPIGPECSYRPLTANVIEGDHHG